MSTWAHLTRCSLRHLPGNTCNNMSDGKDVQDVNYPIVHRKENVCFDSELQCYADLRHDDTDTNTCAVLLHNGCCLYKLDSRSSGACSFSGLFKMLNLHPRFVCSGQQTRISRLQSEQPEGRSKQWRDLPEGERPTKQNGALFWDT